MELALFHLKIWATDQSIIPQLEIAEVGDADEYTIQISTFENFDDEDIILDETISTTNLNVPLGTLNFGATYFWHANVTKDDVTSDWTPTRSFTTQSTILTSPANNATNQILTTEFQWDAIDNAESYSIQISTNTEFTDVIHTQTVSSNSYVIPVGVLNFGTNYHWRVNVTGSEETTNYCAHKSFTTQTTILTSPANNATNQILTTEFQWDAIDNAESYSIQISTNTEFTDVIHTQTVSSNSYVIPVGALNFGTNYHWRVNVTGSEETTNYCAHKSFTTQSTILTSPENNATNIGITSIFQWQSVSGADSYDLQISRTANFSDIVVEALAQTSNNYTVPDEILYRGFDYYWRVAVNVGTWKSNWTQVFKFTTARNMSHNNRFSYQGVLTDNLGAQLNGDYTIKVRIYDDPTSGNYLWEETHSATISNGIFNLILGSINDIDLTFSTAYWIGITINDSDELTPRTPIVGRIYKE